MTNLLVKVLDTSLVGLEERREAMTAYVESWIQLLWDISPIHHQSHQLGILKQCRQHFGGCSESEIDTYWPLHFYVVGHSIQGDMARPDPSGIPEDLRRPLQLDRR